MNTGMESLLQAPRLRCARPGCAWGEARPLQRLQRFVKETRQKLSRAFCLPEARPVLSPDAQRKDRVLRRAMWIDG